MCRFSAKALFFSLFFDESIMLGMSVQRTSVTRRKQGNHPQPIKTAKPTEEAIKEMWKRHKLDRRIEDDQRFDTFRTNVRAAHDANNQQGVDCPDFFDGESCVFGVTKFSHMTHWEFASSRLGFKRSRRSVPPRAVLQLTKKATSDIDSIDWLNATTPVKDQMVCGSCWAVSATETIESSIFLAGGALQELSVQQVVSCDHGSWGCMGGFPDSAYEYVMKVGGLRTATQYPDTSSASGDTGACKTIASSDVTSKITGWSYVVPACESGSCTSQDEDAVLMGLQEMGPLTVCVKADEWISYRRGVFALQTCDSAAESMDHCVQLVGYNHTPANSLPYWIIRNSWGIDWGHRGYMYLAKGSNKCGIANEVTAVTASV